MDTVIARAIGRPAPEAGAGAGDQVIDLTTTATLPSGRVVKKVRAYRDEQKPAGFADPGPVDPVGDPPGEPAAGGPDGGPPRVPDPVADVDVEPVADEPAGDEPAGDGGRPRRRWPWGSVTRTERDERADVIPGLYP
jgi:hypothetical protein